MCSQLAVSHSSEAVRMRACLDHTQLVEPKPAGCCMHWKRWPVVCSSCGVCSAGARSRSRAILGAHQCPATQSQSCALGEHLNAQSKGPAQATCARVTRYIPMARDALRMWRDRLSIVPGGTLFRALFGRQCFTASVKIHVSNLQDLGEGGWRRRGEKVVEWLCQPQCLRSRT